MFKLTPPAPGKTGWVNSVLYAFTGNNGDGSGPQGQLMADSHGDLYGTTSNGGASGSGTVFELTPPAPGRTSWTESVLYSFAGAPGDGTYPNGGLILDAHEDLYGTTNGGGSGGCFSGYGGGTVFRLTPPAAPHTAWTESVLYSFKGANGDGAAPYGGIIADASGALYSTTESGGGRRFGTLFKLSSPALGQANWTESILYRFTKANGSPFAGLIAYGGDLYGTTSAVVFKLMPPSPGQTDWTESVLHFFENEGHYAIPTGGVLARAGVLYGTTEYGGSSGSGNVFKLQLVGATSSTFNANPSL